MVEGILECGDLFEDGFVIGLDASNQLSVILLGCDGEGRDAGPLDPQPLDFSFKLFILLLVLLGLGLLFAVDN